MGRKTCGASPHFYYPISTGERCASGTALGIASQRSCDAAASRRQTGGCRLRLGRLRSKPTHTPGRPKAGGCL